MDFLASLLGHAKLSFHAHPSPLSLPPKDPTANPISLLSFCKKITPPCHLNPLLFNGHLQTFWTTVRSYDIPIHYKRHVFSASDPAFAGTFAVDFVVPAYDNEVHNDDLPPRTSYYTDEEFEELGSEDDTKPMLVTLHGLSGGSHEIYLRHVLWPLVEAGWEACVVNSRGCAKSRITTGVLYNARATWDVRQTVKWLRERWPKRPLFGLGFSLGANILVNVRTAATGDDRELRNVLDETGSDACLCCVQYLGEEGEGCELKAAVVCSNPWNLDVSNLALQRTWVGKEVYSRAMGSSMKRLFEDHVDEVSKNTRVDVEKVRSIKYLFEFDRTLQGPTWGYPTEGAYYRDASSCDSLLAVRIPLLAINAGDDPIAVNEAIPFLEFKQNPFTVLCTTSLGGHLSWFEMGGGRWFAKPASHFLMKMYEEMDLGKLSESSKAKVDAGGVDGEPFASFKPMRRKLHIPADGYH